MVSELLEGQTLRETLRAMPLSPYKAIEVGIQIAHGLSATHEKGIVHRDLKPENLSVSAAARMSVRAGVQDGKRAGLEIVHHPGIATDRRCRNGHVFSVVRRDGPSGLEVLHLPERISIAQQVHV
jgi:serine/threonine protein kinase